MMKTLVLFSVFSLAAVSVFADRADHNDDLARMSHQIDALITQNADQLSLQQTAQVYQLFARIQQTIGKPLPPVPVTPPNPPVQPFTSCASDAPQVMQSALESIKNFAYNVNGLNMNDQDASNYALQWTQNYACSAAPGFIRDGLNIYSLAYEANGFNMNASDATQYTKNALERRCQSGVNFAQEGQAYYNVAYSSSGMNMNASDASAYAQKQMNAKYFHCGGFHQ
jgi:hypothetical protein